MLREAIRNYLAADNALALVLSGGVYPLTTGPRVGQTELTRAGAPLAFDEMGALRPSALVQEEGTVQDGPHPAGALTVVRILTWQQTGRDQIEAAQERVFDLLNGTRLVVGRGFIYRIRWAGTGPSNLRDPALGDASLGWQRWQVNRMLVVGAGA